MKSERFPDKQGLYDPRFEHDSCGVGFVCDIKGRSSHTIIKQGLEVLSRLSHRGATGADPKTGDGAGILIQIPHEFLRRSAQKRKLIYQWRVNTAQVWCFYLLERRSMLFVRMYFLR